jgi:RNA exonuclease NGL2
MSQILWHFKVIPRFRHIYSSSLKKHIIEVDNYDQFFKESFEKLGYQSHYYHHPIKRHGCVIAYKQSKFTLSDEETVDYNTESYSPPSYMTGNVAQVLAIRSKEHPEVGFIVGNTHLYWRPDAIYERLRQTMIYATRFLEFKGKQSSDVRWISLLLGGKVY